MWIYYLVMVVVALVVQACCCDTHIQCILVNSIHYMHLGGVEFVLVQGSDVEARKAVSNNSRNNNEK